MDIIEKKVLAVILSLGISLADWAVKKMGEPIAGKILCKIGVHDWELMPNTSYKMICRRCHIIDDIRTPNIDGDTK